MIACKQGDWRSAKVGGQRVMTSAANGNYIGLSNVGARIWGRSSGRRIGWTSSVLSSHRSSTWRRGARRAEVEAHPALDVFRTSPGRSRAPHPHCRVPACCARL